MKFIYGVEKVRKFSRQHADFPMRVKREKKSEILWKSFISIRTGVLSSMEYSVKEKEGHSEGYNFSHEFLTF